MPDAKLSGGMDPAVRARGLVKRYGDLEAVVDACAVVVAPSDPDPDRPHATTNVTK